MGKPRGRNLVQKLLRAADSPYFELPKAWHVLSRYRSAELFLKHPSPPPVAYNDKGLYTYLLERYPEVKLQPLRLNSSQQSLASHFVAAQQQLIQQARLQQQQQPGAEGQQQQQQPALLSLRQQRQASRQQLPPEVLDAFLQVQARRDIHKQLQAAGSETSAGGYLELLQEQEEEVLQRALHKLSGQEAALYQRSGRK